VIQDLESAGRLFSELQVIGMDQRKKVAVSNRTLESAIWADSGLWLLESNNTRLISELLEWYMLGVRASSLVEPLAF